MNRTAAEARSGRGQAQLALGWVGLLLALLSVAFGPPQLTEADQPQAPLYGYQLGLMAQDSPPDIGVRAALIMDRASGRTVYERQGHQRLAPASTTKIMTAIVALERGQLTDRVVVKREYLAPLEGTGSSVMGLLPGDELTLEDLLWGLLLPSGNDAALVIANSVGGTVENFVLLMNEKVSALGLKDTHFTSPHGLDADDHYSSAYDLAAMGRYALQNPTFARMVASERKVIAASRTFSLVNTNSLLERPDLYPGVDGIKTGTTENAGECIVASVTREGHPVIAVIMGSKERLPDIVKLTNYAYGGFEWMPLPLPAFLLLPDSQGARQPVALPPRLEMIPPWERFRVRLAARLDAGAGQPPAGARVGIAIYTIEEQAIELPLSLVRP